LKTEQQSQDSPVSVSASEVIAFQADVAVSSGVVRGIGISHLKSQADPLSRHGTDAIAFAYVLTKSWRDVYQLDFVDNHQPVDTEIPCLISLVVARKDGKAKREKLIPLSHSKDHVPRNLSR
jgi:hypothetical protein